MNDNPPCARLSVWQGDITTLAVDAIVNAANESLLGGGGVDGAIHRAAGPELLEYCRGLEGCPTGEARLTPGFALPAPWIIHTVGPVWRGGGAGEAQLLADCYRACFALAGERRWRQLALPAISCGVYGYPLSEACTIAVQECLVALAQQAELAITLVAFSGEVAEAYRSAVDVLCGKL